LPDHITGIAVTNDPSRLDKKHSTAESLHGSKAVANEDNGSASMYDFVQLAETLSDKGGVANREHFIDKQNLWIKVSGDRECQSHLHPAAVPFHRNIDEGFDSSKGDNFVEAPLDAFSAHPEQ
jgi:hypothetical protein